MPNLDSRPYVAGFVWKNEKAQSNLKGTAAHSNAPFHCVPFSALFKISSTFPFFCHSQSAYSYPGALFQEMPLSLQTTSGQGWGLTLCCEKGKKWLLGYYIFKAALFGGRILSRAKRRWDKETTGEVNWVKDCNSEQYKQYYGEHWMGCSRQEGSAIQCYSPFL